MNNDASTPIGVNIESKTNMVWPEKHTQKKNKTLMHLTDKPLMQKPIKTV